MPDAAKRGMIQPLVVPLSLAELQTAFLVARCDTAGLHLAIVAYLMATAWQASVKQLLDLAFLSVAWFWLLLPTLDLGHATTAVHKAKMLAVAIGMRVRLLPSLLAGDQFRQPNRGGNELRRSGFLCLCGCLV